MTPDPLTLVTDRPREYWGEAWLVLQSCAGRVDPARGGLASLFAGTMRRRRIDRWRVETKRGKVKPALSIDQSRRIRTLAQVLPQPDPNRPSIDWPKLDRAMDKLSDDERVVMGLVARGMTCKQIGRALGVKAKTVQTWLNRGRAKVVEGMEAEVRT